MNVLLKTKKHDDEITNYKSGFDFSAFEINDEEILDELNQKEEILKKNIIKNVKSKQEIAKSLYEIQKLMANHRTGAFIKYLEYVGIGKDRAYNLIDSWNLYQTTNLKKVFDLPQRLLTDIKQEIKRNNEIIETEIVEIIENENPKEKLNEIKEKREEKEKQIEEEKIINSPDILEKKIKNIEKEIQKYISKISELEKEKDDLMKNL